MFNHLHPLFDFFLGVFEKFEYGAAHLYFYLLLTPCAFLAKFHCDVSCCSATQEGTAVSQRFGWGGRNTALELCNRVTSSGAHKWTRSCLSTVTGGPAKKSFVTLSQRVVLMLCAPVRSCSVSFALCLHLLDWTHTLRGSVSQMHADKLAHESAKTRLDLFSLRAHTHTLALLI